MMGLVEQVYAAALSAGLLRDCRWQPADGSPSQTHAVGFTAPDDSLPGVVLSGELYQISIHHNRPPEIIDCVQSSELVPQEVIRAVSSHITYEPANGHLEVLSKDTGGREALARIVADGLLQSPITGEKIPIKQYDYQSLAAPRAFDLTGENVASVKVFYLQAEVQYHYLRERVKEIRLPPSRIGEARVNFVATPQLRLILDDAGLAQVIPAIKQAFGDELPDIIAIDPIRNVFDGGESGGENDNAAMLYFLSQRVERLRDAVNPDAGIVLAHHTKKLGKKQFEEDPFQALAGAGSLRGYYTTGMLLFRPDETRTTRQLFFELRNGAAIPSMHVDKIRGEWWEVDANERLVMKDYGERLDAERRRKRDAILQILFDEAAQGRCYTANQFAESFEGKAGLGGERTIRERLSALSTQGYIKYFRNAQDYGLPPARTKFGYVHPRSRSTCSASRGCSPSPRREARSSRCIGRLANRSMRSCRSWRPPPRPLARRPSPGYRPGRTRSHR